MWCLGTWFSGGLGSARWTVGLDDLTGLFQPKWFYDSKRLPTQGVLRHVCILHSSYASFRPWLQHFSTLSLCWRRSELPHFLHHGTERETSDCKDWPGTTLLSSTKQLFSRAFNSLKSAAGYFPGSATAFRSIVCQPEWWNTGLEGSKGTWMACQSTLRTLSNH